MNAIDLGPLDGITSVTLYDGCRNTRTSPPLSDSEVKLMENIFRTGSINDISTNKILHYDDLKKYVSICK